jgi:hypothetical protein
MPDPGSWGMWAHDCNGEYQHPGNKWWVEIHGLPDPVVPVTVTEVPDNAPDGTHWGWIESKQAAAVYNRAANPRPCRIWAFRGAFDMQFPYRPAAEVAAGKGRVVRLRVTAREDSDRPEQERQD